MRFKRSSLQAFTLVELLVVIAIIAVLAALLLPALSSAKQKGKQVQCINNLRQLQLAWLTYAHDHDDWLPPNEGGDSFVQRPNWVGGWLDYSVNNRDNTNTVLLLREWPGSLGPYTQNASLYKCPSDRSWALISNKKEGRVRSYSLNGWVGRLAASTDANYKETRRLTEFLNPPPGVHDRFVVVAAFSFLFAL